MKLELKHFYFIAAFLYIVMTSADVGTFFSNLDVTTTFNKIRSVASILINCLFIALFVWLYRASNNEQSFKIEDFDKIADSIEADNPNKQ